MESLKCIGRADLTLNGTFADLILLPSIGARGLNSKDDLFVLTNPGQIHYYDNDSLSALMSEQNRTSSVSAQEFPVLIPMNNPSLTVAKLIKLPSQLNSSKTLAEVISFVFQYFLLNLATYHCSYYGFSTYFVYLR
jgi:syntaxin-binding protein 5